MAKESIKARERKRAKMVAQYAEKRAALKEIVRKGEPEEVEKAVMTYPWCEEGKLVSSKINRR